MNWYKEANLYEEIKKHGPIPITPELQNKSIEELQQLYPNLSIEQIQLIKKDPWKFRFNEHERRRPFFKNYGWSVPSEEAIQELTQFANNQTILEIGAGHGLWAKLLQDAGAKVIPTNLPLTPKDKYLDIKVKPFTQIEYINHLNALRKYNTADILMMSWPPCEDPMAYDALSNFNGNKLIFIGESRHGCTADDNFFDLLENEWELIKVVNIPQRTDIHDDLSIYQRK